MCSSVKLRRMDPKIHTPATKGSYILCPESRGRSTTGLDVAGCFMGFLTGLGGLLSDAATIVLATAPDPTGITKAAACLTGGAAATGVAAGAIQMIDKC